MKSDKRNSSACTEWILRYPVFYRTIHRDLDYLYLIRLTIFGRQYIRMPVKLKAKIWIIFDTMGVVFTVFRSKENHWMILLKRNIRGLFTETTLAPYDKTIIFSSAVHRTVIFFPSVFPLMREQTYFFTENCLRLILLIFFRCVCLCIWHCRIPPMSFKQTSEGLLPQRVKNDCIIIYRGGTNYIF